MRKFAAILTTLLLPYVALYGQSKSFFWGNNSVTLVADTNRYQTSVFGTQNGLPSSEISCLVQDRKGYVWIGTSAGASRFDGIKFENFLKADNHLTGKIYSIKEDTVREVIWIACDAGICYFDNKQLRLAHLAEKDLTVYEIYLLKDKNIWICTGKGPALLQQKIISDLLSDSIISITSYILPQWIQVNNVNSPAYKIISSENGDLYFAGAGSMFFYNNKNLEQIWASRKQQNNNDYVVGMVSGEGNEIFFATAFSGLNSVKGKEVKKLQSDDYGSGDLIKHNGQIYFFALNGIFKFSAETYSLEKISNVPENLNVWMSCLLVDNENNLWIGLHDNLLYQKPQVFYSYNNVSSDVNPELFSIFQLRNNQLLFGANRGKVYSKNGKKFTNIFGSGRAVQRAEIESIYEDRRGWLWLATGYDGIAIVADKKIFHVTRADGLSTNSNYFFYEDAAKNMYTGGDGGLSRVYFDESKNNFVFKNFIYKVAGENLKTFNNCVEGPDGSLWLGGQLGIFHLKNDSLSAYRINNEISLSVTDLKKSKAGDIWLTTKGDGIWRCYFDKNNLLRLKKIFTQKDGLQSDMYLGITIDNENNVWAGSYFGITSIKEKDFTVSNYTSTDGYLSSNYESLKIYCDRDDTIWVATSSGLASFYVKRTDINRKLELNFKNISLLKTSKNIADFKKNRKGSIVVLPYFLNEIEFRFKAVCLSDPQKIRYSFRLIGLEDTAWVPWNNKEVALYQNLSPGKYWFEVKASLDNNTFTKPIIFPFIISKPFWFSWWFITLCSVSIIFIFYFSVKKWKKNIQEKNGEKIKTQQLISENLQYQLEVEQVTNYFATSISTSETVDDLLWNVARRCISKLNFEDCVIYLIDEKTNKLIQKAAWGPKSGHDNQQNVEANEILGPIEIPVGQGIVGAVALSGIAEIVPDVTKDPRYIKDDMQRFSEIAVPVIYNNNTLGVIDSESQQKNFYSQRHLQILTAIASHCADRIVKLKAEEDLRRNEQELLQTRNRLAEEKLTALRSQMNPHFIFNCLNSIQQYILQGEVDTANKYLSQFSRLIRLVLQYSEYNFISLEDEINMLKLYLSLEKIRFGNSFQYYISVEDELDAEEIKIPNLMVQPFVENAIWHGLMHKEGDRNIGIKFSLINEQSIVCEITDNGIGRKRAKEIKEMKLFELKHNSKGMQLVKDKIDILKQQFTSDVSIEISDTINSDGEVSGTRVLIQLPLQY
ncbi:MAG: two-component regulator propeller domain-containing protein [Ginsengibacter sp.]